MYTCTPPTGSRCIHCVRGLAVGLVNRYLQLNYNRTVLTVEFNSLLGPDGCIFPFNIDSPL